MCTQEKSAFALWRCRRGYAAESQHHCQWPTLYWGRDFSKTFFFPLTEAGILVSTKFSKVLRTTSTISCQCYPLLIGLYASSHHYQRKSSSLQLSEKNILLSTKREWEASLPQYFLMRTAELWTLPEHICLFVNIGQDSFWKHCKLSHLTLSSLPQITTLNWKLSPARMPGT